MFNVRIAPEDSGKKLHRYMRQTLPGMPLSGVYKLIRVGRVKVNGKKGKMETLLQPGDEVSVLMREEEYESLAKPKRKFAGMRSDIDVIYEDAHLLVVNKPVGLLTHPDQSEHKDTLIGRALAYLHAKGEIADGRSFLPATVNRLDRNTSGIVLIGKDTETLRQLGAEIRDHHVKKTYLTIVCGTITRDGEINVPLLRTGAGNRTTAVFHATDAGAKSALTRYRVLGKGDGTTLLEVDLASGRTHQIRVHLSSIGHPLVGDVKYGGKTAYGLTHHLLHAQQIRLADDRFFTAPVPNEFQTVLERCGISTRLCHPR